MIINLDEVWFVDADTTSVSLNERRVIQAKEEGAKGIAPKAENIGKERIQQHGFYGNIKQACDAYLQKGVASMPGMLAATQIIAAWADMTARIEAATRGLKRSEVGGHKDPVSVRSSKLLVSDGNGGTIELPLKSPEPLYDLPQAEV